MSKVVFVAGAARSGSTLLGEILGAQPRVLDAGEVALFWRDAARGNTCACGVPLTACELWGGALSDLQSSLGLDPSEYAALAATRAQLARTTRPARLRALLRDGSVATTAEKRLIEATSALYEAALKRAGADVLVDTSKTLPSLLFHGLTPERPVELIHLVRDARAVAASTVRSRAVARGNAESLPPGGGLGTSIARWLWANATTRIGARRLGSVQTVQYDTLMGDPEGVVRRLCGAAGVEFDPATLADRTLRMPHTSHAAVGNPRRGATVTELVLDERWRTELTTTQQRVVRSATWPLQRSLARREG